MKLRSTDAFSSGSPANISRTEAATFLATRKRPSLYLSTSAAPLAARWTFLEPAKTTNRSLTQRAEKWAASPFALCVHTTL